MRVNLIVRLVLSGSAAFLSSVGECQRFDNRSPQQIEIAESRCRTEAATLINSSDKIAKRRAMSLAKACPDTGAALLAAVWRNPPSDSVLRSDLRFNSLHIIDARIANSTVEMVRNRSASVSTRIAALEVLVTQLNPAVMVGFGPILKNHFVPLPGQSTIPDREFVSTRQGMPPMQQTRGKSVIDASIASRLRADLRELQHSSDDYYLLLAVREALSIIGEPRA